jgi:5'-3' exoribonuclease 1
MYMYISLSRNLILKKNKYTKQVSHAAKRESTPTSFKMLFLNVLREYFDLEFSPLKEKMKIEYRIERIIDDLILIFFFLGNDFLPRCYCFDIRQGNIEHLI